MEILSSRDHVFTHGGVQHLTLLLELASACARQERPNLLPGSHAPAAAAAGNTGSSGKAEDPALILPADLLAPVTDGLPFLGLRVYPGLMRVLPASLRRVRRKLKQREARWRDGERDAEQLATSAKALCGRFQRLRMRVAVHGTLGSDAARQIYFLTF